MNIMLRNALRQNIGLRHQLEKNLLGDGGDSWEDEFKKFLRQEPCWVKKDKAKVSAPLLLRSIASGVSIAAVPAAKVADCFKVGDGVFAYRDSDFDRWLPAEIPAVGLGIASTFELMQELNFKEMIEAHLGVERSLDEIKKILIEREKYWSLWQIDGIIRRCEKGDNSLKLWVDPNNIRANLFPTVICDSVFMVYAYRYSRGWYVYLDGFAGADCWGVGYCLSLRN